MPDSLLQHPCKASPAGDTVRSLAKGYVKNTYCLGQYQILVEKQNKFKDEVEALYGSQ